MGIKAQRARRGFPLWAPNVGVEPMSRGVQCFHWDSIQFIDARTSPPENAIARKCSHPARLV